MFDQRSTHKFREEDVRKFLCRPVYVKDGFMEQRANTARTERVAVRLTREDQRQIEEAAKTKGYANPSAFIRAAIRNELDGRAELNGTEQRIAGGFDRVSRDIFRLGWGQQALFAILDAFTKAVLTCVPEPPPEARPQAIARARERYDRLVKVAAKAMSGDSRAAMQDLIDHGSN